MDNKKKIKITIAIPAYNAELTLAETIKSAKAQDHPETEILVLDDGSTDKTYQIAEAHGCRVVANPDNQGIGKALESLMQMAQGKYIVYLCSDDVFTNSQVVSDMVRAFDNDPKITILSRYYYQYMNGHKGAINVCRETNLYLSVCNPSGVGFKVNKDAKSTNDIFIEMPTMAAWFLKQGGSWAMMTYDTIAARIHPGGNTGTKTSYYNGSMYKNWYSVVGKDFRFHVGFIQVKNRSPKTLFNEIRECVRGDRRVLTEFGFWFFVTIALIVPGFILRPLSNFYRHRIARHFYTIIERPEK